MKEIIVCGAGRVFAFQIISATLGSSRVGREKGKKISKPLAEQVGRESKFDTLRLP